MRATHAKPLRGQRLLDALAQLGGEATLQSLWRRTGIALDRADAELATGDVSPRVERVLPPGCSRATGIDLADRRWRLRSER